MKELCLKKMTKDESFVERDLILTVALLNSLSQRALTRRLSKSEKNGLETLTGYLRKCFLGSDILFGILGKLWEANLCAICGMA